MCAFVSKKLKINQGKYNANEWIIGHDPRADLIQQSSWFVFFFSSSETADIKKQKPLVGFCNQIVSEMQNLEQMKHIFGCVIHLLCT